jgi:predicted TIM-barrel fold metal-dependent hydrolase
MIVDAHVHLMSFPAFADLRDKIETTADLIAFRSRYPDVYARARTEEPVDNSDQLLSTMDHYGVRYAVVQSRPGRITNDHIAAAVARHPDRLFGLFSFGKLEQMSGYEHDLARLREQVLGEIDDCVKRLGLRGMGETHVRSLTSEIHPELIARDLEPLMLKLAEHGVPMQLQTAWTQWKGGLWFGDPLWVDEIAGRHPTVPIILTKMGRGIQTFFDHALTVAMRNENVYFDTVGTTPAHLRQAVDAIGSHRIMFGTDWSTTWAWVKRPADLYTLRLRTIDEAGLSEAERADVLWRTACRLFSLPDPVDGGV